MSIKQIDELDIKEKTLFIRADFDTSPGEYDNILEYKIDKAIDTISYSLNQDARIVIASHIQVPSSKFDKRYSLYHIAQKISERISRNVYFPDNCVGDAVKKIKNEMRNGEVMLLENLMFHSAEIKNDSAFAKILAVGIDVYVNDSFSIADSNFASNNAILSYIPEKCAGHSFMDDIKNLNKLKDYEGDDLGIYFGGDDIDIKLDFLEAYVERVKVLILGGRFLYSFLYSIGYSVNKQFVDESVLYRLKKLFSSFKTRNKKIMVPDDFYVSSLNNLSDNHIIERKELMDNMYIHGFGSLTAESYESELKKCNFILWDGFFGVYKQLEPGIDDGVIFPSLLDGDRFVVLISDSDILLKKRELCYNNKISSIISRLTAYKYLQEYKFESLDKLSE